ncbi:MAG: hypothetical protein JAZ15_15740, partial [Candidatus Thiodiazotropha endolucinida]|nr:hypothetical protein [Candidatus Thiodiazotropha taylori]MCW4314471.1 hypothetical protein [Candidatus Thiodiazotropha taylori]
DRLFHFENYRLDSVVAALDNSQQLNLTFSRSESASLVATCEFFKGRMRILNLEIKKNNEKQLEAHLDYLATDPRLVSVISIATRRVKSRSETDGGLNADSEFGSEDSRDFELKFDYKPESLLLDKLIFQTPHLAQNLNNLIAIASLPIDSPLFLDSTFTIEFEGDYGITDHSTLSRAYIPFRSNYNSEAFREVATADLRWLLSQDGVNQEIIIATCKELGRRATMHVPANTIDNEITTMIDLVSGQFDRDLIGLSGGTVVIAKAKAIAASALLASFERQSPQIENPHLERIITNQMIDLLAGLSSNSATVSTSIAEALNSFQFTLKHPQEIFLLPRTSNKIDILDGKYEAGWRLTTAWVEALGRCAQNKALAYQIVKNLISSGLESHAYKVLQSGGMFDSPAAETVQHWLANELLPESKPVETVASLPDLNLRLRQFAETISQVQSGKSLAEGLSRLSMVIRGEPLTDQTSQESTFILMEKLLDDLTIFYRSRASAQYKSNLSNILFLAQVSEQYMD